MLLKEMLVLLAELIACHSPPGEEAEIDTVILREFKATSAKVWQDGMSNIYAHLPGDGLKVMVCAHKDEIGMIVTDILPDGRLKVRNIGGALPWKYGEGPVDILADDGNVVRAILSVGSTHTRTGPLSELRDKRALTWDLVTLYTGLTPQELAAAGVHVGSRAVVCYERKQLQNVGAMIASFALDDRLGLVSIIAALRQLSQETLPLDLYFVASSQEEVGLRGAVRAAQQIQPDVCIALDTSPASHGTPVKVNERPVIWYAERAYHSKEDSDMLLKIAKGLGFGAQPAIYDAAGSDAAGVQIAGLADRTVTFGYARDNSHGYEIAHPDSLMNVTALLIAFLKQL